MTSVKGNSIFIKLNRICVHAIPASDAEEYQGMPMFAEVGPLVLDPQVLAKVESYMSSESDNITF